MERFALLDSRAHDILLSWMAVPDLLALSRTSRAWKAVISAYGLRAYNIEKLLAPFFSSPDNPYLIPEFRYIQAQTGAIISGSAALQFFARTRYPESDLDVYVEVEFAEQIILFLFSAGYAYAPRPLQDGVWRTELDIIRRGVANQEQVVYHWNRMAGVFNFRKDEKVIQLIMVQDSPVSMVLSYHSTVVMNIITHKNAFCLYPNATFIKHKTYECRVTVGDARAKALEKYEKRGWRITGLSVEEYEPFQAYNRDLQRRMRRALPLWLRNYRYGNDNEMDDESDPQPHLAPHELTPGVRWIGDNLTWTIPLPNIETPTGEYTPPREMLHAHSWRMTTQGLAQGLSPVISVDREPGMKFKVVVRGPNGSLQDEMDDIRSRFGVEFKEQISAGHLLDEDLSELVHRTLYRTATE